MADCNRAHVSDSDLRCNSYADCYQRDFPKLFEQIDDISQVTDGRYMS